MESKVPGCINELINTIKNELLLVTLNQEGGGDDDVSMEVVAEVSEAAEVAEAAEVSEVAEGAETVTKKKSSHSISSTIVYVLKKYRFWPALQVKKFFANKNLILLHNTYKRMDVRHFQKLYDQCRSIVLDFSAPEGENIVVTYTHSIPDRISDTDYKKVMKDTDIIESSYEGTVVTVYYYKGIWYFGTTSCPTIDSSRYFHPTKTHGTMLDEVIANITDAPSVPTTKEESMTMRQAFANSTFDTEKAYAFILVHHQNSHVMNYTSTLGENYMKLVHIVTRSRTSYVDDDLTHQPFSGMKIIYPTKFATPDIAIQYLYTAPDAYGFIVRTNEGKMLKVSIDSIVQKEDHDIGNPNPWYNMLHVYMKQKATYKINDYIKEFDVKLTLPKSSRGIDMDPTYIIHTSIVTMRDFLLKFYNDTTTFDMDTQRYTINKEADAKYAPIIRFHLVQLRNIQVTRHKHAVINDKTVYIYLCRSQTIKNLRMLIKYFATTWIEGPKLNGIPYRAAESLVELNKLLD